MKSGKLQKFNAATITISDNVARHNKPYIAIELQWMKQFTVLDRRHDMIFKRSVADNTRLVFSSRKSYVSH